MSNHTTGPWIYAIPGDSFVASDNGLICRRPAVSGGGSAPNNWEANARLIAAAPDLLAFAQEWLERQGTDENYMTAKARAAIGRAAAEIGRQMKNGGAA